MTTSLATAVIFASTDYASALRTSLWGTPLIIRSILQVRSAKAIGEVVVVCADASIAGVAAAAGARVIEITPERAVGGAFFDLLDALSGPEAGMLAVIDPCFPALTGADIDSALARLHSQGSASLVSVSPVEGPLRDVHGAFANDAVAVWAPGGLWRENGTIRAGTAGALRRQAGHFNEPVCLFANPEAAAIRLRSAEEVARFENLFAKVQGAKPLSTPAPGSVKLVVFDFDGVMSDNRVLVMQDGAEGALCNRSDGLGIGMLKNAGMPMMVMSKEQNPVVGARCRKLGLECHQGVDDKLTRLRELAAARAIDFSCIAYVGNDINDLACMRAVGWPIAVADAYPQVLAAARMVTTRPGGHGAVREVCDALLGVVS
jgi:N-acylneuraminate cytidylyltransferase